MDELNRREFLTSVPAAAIAAAAAGCSSPSREPGPGEAAAPASAPAGPAAPPAMATGRLRAFDFDGVRLGPGRWQRQVQSGRDFYLSIPDENILHGCRAATGLPAPGAPLGGWCGVDSNSVFGQWLSGMSRMYRATGDSAMRDKAVGLFTEWAKTIKPDGDARMRHYAFDKLVCARTTRRRS